MQEKNLNAQGGLTPLCLGSPQNTIPPNQVIRPHRSKSSGGKGGLALPPPSSYLCFLFHLLIKGILWSPKIHTEDVFFNSSDF